MKRVALILGLLWAGTAAAQTTTFNGVIRDLTNTPVPTGQVLFNLKPGIDTTTSGSSRFVPTTTICEIHNPGVVSTSGTGTITVVVNTAQTWQVGDSLIFVGTADATLNGSSVASPYTITAVNSTTSFNFTQSGTHTNGAGGTVGGLYKSGGTGACAVMQNTALTPANTSYQVSINAVFSPTSSFNTYAIGAGPVDISTVVPTPGQMPAYSFVDGFSNQSIGGNKTFTGNIAFTGLANFNGGGALNGSFSGNPALTGNVTATAGANTFACKQFENIRCVDAANSAGWSGATADAWIAAAFANLPNGGTVDARGLGAGTQSWANTQTIGDGTHAFSLVCDPGTKFAVSSASLVALQVKQGARISGCKFDTTGVTFTGSVLQFGSLTRASDPGPFNPRSPDVYGCSATSGSTCLYTVVEGVEIDGNWTDTGHAIDFLASNQFTSFDIDIKLNNVVVNGLVCLNVQTAGTGYANTNKLANLTCNSKTGVVLNAAGGNITGNIFWGLFCEGLSDAAAVCVKAQGTAFVNRNVFAPAVAWDFAGSGTAVDFSGSVNYQNNVWIGTLNGAATQFKQNASNSSNVFLDPGSSTFLLSTGWANPIIASNLTANEGVSGQGAILDRDGGSGGATLGPVGAISGTNRATSLKDGAGVSQLSVLGNGLTTIGSSGLQINGGGTINAIYSGSATLTFTAIAAQTCQEQTITVTNANAGKPAFFSPGASLGNTNLSWSSWVSSSNTVSVRVCNPTAGSITPSAVTWSGWVQQ